MQSVWTKQIQSGSGSSSSIQPPAELPPTNTLSEEPTTKESFGYAGDPYDTGGNERADGVDDDDAGDTGDNDAVNASERVDTKGSSQGGSTPDSGVTGRTNPDAN